ncbi:MAG: PEGA domain-containing protein [Planctomycetes bacterium]|nr:PEGA domain-containing protein [Planctomycetota bacterium]
MRTAGARQLLAPLAAALLCGCVHREIEIMTRPPGARVEFDGEVFDRPSPVRIPFDWYGTHEIIVQKPGYFRERLFVHIAPPWYQQFPLDFFSELLWPGRIYHICTYPLVLDKELPMDDVPDDEKTAMKVGVIERGEAFRRMAREQLGLPPVPEKKEEPPKPEEPAPPGPPAKE